MSNNYYIRTKDSEMAFDLMPRVEIISECREFEIHICQTVGGLTPIFEAHSYNNFKGLKDILLSEKYTFRIIDEYGIEIKPKDFIEMVISDNKNSTPRSCKYKDLLDDKTFYIDADGFEWQDCEFS